MSNKLRNPFRMRASEKIESDASFLHLFSPMVLEALYEKHEKGKLWDNVLFIHSSPGAGKTSLLRIFDPGSLSTLFINKSSSDYKELFTSLKRIEAINNDGIDVLGVTLVCTGNYEILEELELSIVQKQRLFFSLLNIRIVIATLRSILTLNQKRFPEDLEKIEFTYKNQDNYFTSLNVPCNGKVLFEWASSIEKKIYSIIDSFLPEEMQAEGHSELYAFTVLKPENIKFDGQPVCKKILFMLDDTHKLSFNQREALTKYLIDKRGNFSIWISERLEALDPTENLGSFKGRDYDEINLERFWDKKISRFESILLNIAEKRARISTEDIDNFQEYIQSELNEESYKQKFMDSITLTLDSIRKLTLFSSKFSEWLKYAETFEGTPFERALMLKAIEIIINRNKEKSQLSFDFALTVQELTEKINPGVEAAAKLFLSEFIKLPYYYSFSNLCKLSSNNIEQFLTYSADLFEEMISNKLRGTQLLINSEVQEKIINKVVERKWRELPRIVPYSNFVIKFLSELGEFSKKETYKSNAPYAPGVNGFAIKPGNINLFEKGSWLNNSIYEPLINVISTCVAFNLLEIKEVNQGEKGQHWEVYYLNRWLCVKFNLPLSYGGWRHKSPDDLLKWMIK
jgi:hypothetical protein